MVISGPPLFPRIMFFHSITWTSTAMHCNRATFLSHAQGGASSCSKTALTRLFPVFDRSHTVWIWSLRFYAKLYKVRYIHEFKNWKNTANDDLSRFFVKKKILKTIVENMSNDFAALCIVINTKILRIKIRACRATKSWCFRKHIVHVLLSASSQLLQVDDITFTLLHHIHGVLVKINCRKNHRIKNSEWYRVE